MLSAEREHNGVIGCRRLQLEVERSTKSFAQRQPPSPIQPDAERRMDDQLHSARLIKKALQHEFVLRRNHSQGLVDSSKIIGKLARSGLRKTRLFLQPFGEIQLRGPGVRVPPFERCLRGFFSISVAQRGDRA